MRGIRKGKLIFRGLAIRDPSGNTSTWCLSPTNSLYSLLLLPVHSLFLAKEKKCCSLARCKRGGGQGWPTGGCFRLVRFMGDRPFPLSPSSSSERRDGREGKGSEGAEIEGGTGLF